ncbi:hypothetical protein FBZ96_11435 [Bradyrhizobium stylosanthis]|uniref:Uncharacterized protein n=1 Tax=Bradyrhizobium stylosanthis TaxID=1803665 RepID=A0A560D1R0_9BRAD|nr:hypothetical protein FBZ96_11435 [Bradyrhizobium stylosanthis]
MWRVAPHGSRLRMTGLELRAPPIAPPFIFAVTNCFTLATPVPLSRPNSAPEEFLKFR